MSRNKPGTVSRAPKEWGRKSRKDEEHYRGFRKRAEQDAVREALEEMDQELLDDDT